MSEKIIIQVGGTAFSGSTLLDLMLANDEHAFSCGEMCNLFEPVKRQYVEAKCSCTNENCRFWHNVREKGSENVWDSLNKYFPDIKVFVDSSKNIKWHKTTRDLILLPGSAFKNILIWKSPAEYAYSCLKRGREKNWAGSYVNYHLEYFQTFNNVVTVSYSELIENPAGKLEKICDSIGIPYFLGKENYWNKKEYHTLFGSSTAKLHLYEMDSPRFKSIVADRTKHESMMEANIQRAYKYHRRFFPTDKAIFDKLPDSIQKEINTAEKISKIHDLLRAAEVESLFTRQDINSMIASIRPYRPPLQQRIANRLKKYLSIR